MFEIQTKSPTRVDLSGGTLDFWPLYLFLENPVTINVAIDIFTYVELRERSGPEIELVTHDLKEQKTYPNLEACLSDDSPTFDLVRAHLRYWRPSRGFTLATRSESPIGGGLGGSSSLCISLLKAFSKWMNYNLPPQEMVTIASHLEAQTLGKPTGTQDYFPPLFGGLNCITYGVGGPKVEVKAINQELFKDRFLLVYTGRAHHSGINNWQVIKNWLDGDAHTKKTLERLALVSRDMNEAMMKGRFGELPTLFTREFEARTAISDGFSSPEIRQISDLAREVGAVAKICGAGGGGCVLIWCPDQQIAKARGACEAKGFKVLSAQPWSA